MISGFNHAVYLDWENFWLGFLQKIFPQYISRDSPPPALDPNHRLMIERFPSVLVDSIKSSIGTRKIEALGSTVVFPDKVASKVRFIKAHSEWSFLPLASEIQLLALVRSVGIIPHQSLARQFKTSKSTRVIKEATDRALILKVVEDLFLRKSTNIDSVIIGTGDVGFIPLIEFLIEHTSFNVGIITIGSHVLSNDLKSFVEANFGSNSVHILDQDQYLKVYYDECKGKLPAKPEVELSLPIDKPIASSAVICDEVLKTEEAIPMDKEKIVYTKLIVGLLRTNMPYVSRGHFVNRWVNQNKRDYLDDINNDDIADAMIEKGILLQKEREGGIMEIVINQDDELVKEIKKSIFKL